MRLHRLRMTAFGSFPGVEEVDFDALGEAGLFLIHGPTGAGKTTVLDAVCFALYGMVPGLRNSARTLRCDHAPPGRGPEVLLEATIRGRRLRIQRSPSWSRPKLRGQGTVQENAKVVLEELRHDWVALTTRLDEAGDLIGGLLGMNHDQFAQVAMLPQGEFARFLRADGDDRRKLLERLFSVRLYTEVEKWLAEHRRVTGRAEDALRGNVAAAANRMHGAAGDLPVADLGDDPLGWSAALLATAATAASETAASCTAGETALREARTRLEGAQNLADRQKRHAAALIRRDELENTAEERSDLETFLTEAANADRVLPLIQQYDARTAAAELADDHATQALSRLGSSGNLPGSLAASPPELTALEQERRDEIARIEQLRPEESRLAQLRADRDRTGHDIVAMEKIQSEITDRLAVLPVELKEAESRLSHARLSKAALPGAEAAVRAAESTLTAVRRRDTLAAALAEAVELRESSLAAIRPFAPDPDLGQVASWERTWREEAARLGELVAEEVRLAAVQAEAESVAASLTKLAADEATALRSVSEIPDLLDAAKAGLQQARAAAAEIPVAEAACRTARERFEAALRRDELVAESAAADEARRAATDQAQAALDRLLTVRQTRIDGMAAELAANLASGEPCMVCGSDDHPSPAEPGIGAPTAEDEEEAQAEADAAQRVREAAESEAAALAARLEEATDRADGLTVADAETAVAEGESTLTRLTAAAEPETALATRVDELTVARDAARERAEDLRTTLAELRAHERSLHDEQSRITARLDDARAGHPTVAGRRDRIVHEAALLAAALDAVAQTDAVQAKYDDLRGTVPDDRTEDAAAADLREAAAELSRLRLAAADEESGAQETARLTTELTELAERGSRNDIELATARTRAAQLAAEDTRLSEIIDQARGDDATLTARVRRLTDEATALQQAATALREATAAAAERDNARDLARRATLDAGFGGIEDARAAVRTDADRTAMSERLTFLRDEYAAVTALLADPELLAAVAEPVPDLTALAAERARAEQEHEDRASARDQARHRHDRLTALAAELATAVEALRPAEHRHRLARRMAELTNGNSTDNRWDMPLSAYVLGERLRQVVDAANDRLTHMSGGRYLLQYDKRRTAGSRTRAGGGLGLRVLDAWTGIDRDPATLSGGESFITSLALALGLADVVTAEAGGTEIGTLFVDEGFGTLDEDTLDDVLNILDTLRTGGRSVGIVSHVAELRIRIPTQLQVRKTRTGSTLRPA
ncbi:AAA family ATPase [Acrocarpospora catenulata]|uniref:AAA family ATPase n=1 Tax=Acrocarpospora catenulata TaxID=2836182 RepID=UPI001BDA7A4F|nr:AAA family ATPase [Acrocarpospora catenulata]